MRIALVSPYSWSYPGGVTRHIEALAEQFMAGGHHVRVLAPYDPPDRLSARMHRGARPEARELPDWVIPLGRTIGVKSNGAVSNLPHTPYAITTLRRELRAGGFDVIHVHEPVAPVVGYDVLDTTIAPLVGTFHCYSENVVSNTIGNALRRQAQAPAPARAHRRLRGRRVDRPALLRRQLPDHPQRRRRAAPSSRRPRRGRRARRCAWPSSARPSSARGSPSCCAPSRRCATTSRVELIVVGADRDEVEPLHARRHAGRHRAGQGLRRREGRRPGLGRPARRAVAGRRELRHGPHRGLRRRHAGRRLRHPRLSRRRARRGRRRARPARRRHRPGRDAARPRRGARAARGDGRRGARARAALRLADGRRRGPRGLRRTPSPCRGRRPPASAPACSSAPSRPTSGRASRPSGACPASRRPSARAAIAAARPPARPASASPGSPPAFLALLALQRIGLDQIGDSLLRATPTWVLLGLGLMCGSMVVRGVAWHAILHRGAARGAPAALRRPAGHVHRRAHVGHAARAPRRALARADRGAPHRAPARPPADRRGLDRLADAAQRRRAGRPGDRHVLDGRPLQPAPARPRGLRAGADGRPRGRARRCPRCCAAACPRARAASRRRVAKVRAALAQVRAGLRVFRSPKLGAEATALQLTAWAIQWLSCYVLLVALGLDDRAGHRRRRGGALRGQRDRGAAHHAVEPGRLPVRLRRRPGRRLRGRARPTRWPTGSSCRPSRSRPPWSWAPRPWSRRA